MLFMGKSTGKGEQNGNDSRPRLKEQSLSK